MWIWLSLYKDTGIFVYAYKHCLCLDEKEYDNYYHLEESPTIAREYNANVSVS